MPETLGREHNQDHTKKLSNQDKFEIVLKLFGSESAKNIFLGLCREYNDLRRTQKAHEIAGDQEHYRKNKAYDQSPPQRANIHNQIMDTLKRLSLQKLTDTQRSILFELASREFTTRVIHDYLEEENHDEDDEYRNPTKGSSETAYFHSLSRGE